jgi:hypothetical protein
MLVYIPNSWITNMLSNLNMLIMVYFPVWILIEIKNYILLVYIGSLILCEWEMLNLINSTLVMENLNPNSTRYKIKRCTGRVHWTGALRVYRAYVLAYKNTSVYYLSLTYQKRKRVCHYYQRERKREMILC